MKRGRRQKPRTSTESSPQAELYGIRRVPAAVLLRFAIRKGENSKTPSSAQQRSCISMTTSEELNLLRVRLFRFFDFRSGISRRLCNLSPGCS